LLRQVNMNSVRAIDRAVELLEVFTIDRPALTIDEITAATKLPKTTAYRILYTLERHGLIHYDPKTLKYRLGLKILELSATLTSVLDVRREAEDILIDLQMKARQTVVMAVPEHDSLVYIFKRENPEGFKYSSVLGQRRPLHFGVLGQIMLAYLSEQELDRYLSTHALERHTAHTITDADLLKKKLAQIRSEKVNVDMEETFEFGNAIGAPVFNAEGKLIAAVGMIGPSADLNREKIAELKPVIRDVGIEISRRMGCLK